MRSTRRAGSSVRLGADTVHVLVTGGAGLIGSHVVDRLLERGDRVTVLDNLDPDTHRGVRPPWVPDAVRFVEGDVRDPDAVQEALTGVDAVIHQAAFGGFTAELSKYAAVNCVGLVRLFEVIREERLPVRKIVVASSQALYGEGTYHCTVHGRQHPPPRPAAQLAAGRWEVECSECARPLQPAPTPESKPPAGTTMYALSKGTEEQWALSLGRQLGIPTVALRYAVTFGPRQSVHNPYTGVFSIFATRMRNRLPVVVYEDGLQSRDFISAEDVAAANLVVLDSERASDSTFNVGTGRSVTVIEIVTTLADALGYEPEVEISGKYRPQDVRHFLHDATALRAIGWEPTLSFEQGVERYAGWFRAIDGRIDDRFGAAEMHLLDRGVVKLAG